MSWYDRALTAERERDEARQQVDALRDLFDVRPGRGASLRLWEFWSERVDRKLRALAALPSAPEFTDKEPHFIVTEPVETTKPTPKRARAARRRARPSAPDALPKVELPKGGWCETHGGYTGDRCGGSQYDKRACFPPSAPDGAE